MIIFKQRRNSADNRAGKLKELIISFLNLQYKRVGIFIHFSVFHYAILNMHYLSHNCTFKIVICILKISTYHYISTTKTKHLPSNSVNFKIEVFTCGLKME